MNSIWNRLYDSLKDRRYGLLFILSLAVMAVVCGLIAGFRETNVQAHLDVALPLLGACGAIAIGVAICRAVRRRCERPDCSRLSSDELAKARSKLLNKQNRRRP